MIIFGSTRPTRQETVLFRFPYNIWNIISNSKKESWYISGMDSSASGSGMDSSGMY